MFTTAQVVRGTDVAPSGQRPSLVTSHTGDHVAIWLLDAPDRLASASLTFAR